MQYIFRHNDYLATDFTFVIIFNNKMENESQPQKKKWYKKKKYWALIIGGGFILIVILALISGKGMPMLKDVPSKVNQSALSLKGWHVESGSNVKVYLNGDVAMETQADGKGEFDVDLNLTEGKNTLYAVATYKGKLIKGAEEEITYINQEKIDAQNKADADAKAVADAAQQKAADDALRKATADAATQQAELDAKNKADADAKAVADVAQQKATEDAQASADAAKQKAAADAQAAADANSDVTRSAIIKLFPEFNIQKATTGVDGKENYTGIEKKDTTDIQIIGSETDVSEVSLTLTSELSQSLASSNKQEEFCDRLINLLIPGTDSTDLFIELAENNNKIEKGDYNISYPTIPFGGGLKMDMLIFDRK